MKIYSEKKELQCWSLVWTFIALLVLLAIKTAPGQEVTVNFKDGTSYSVTYPSGGTFSTPKRFAKNIKVIDLKNRKGMLLVLAWNPISL